MTDISPNGMEDLVEIVRQVAQNTNAGMAFSDNVRRFLSYIGIRRQKVVTDGDSAAESFEVSAIRAIESLRKQGIHLSPVESSIVFSVLGVASFKTLYEVLDEERRIKMLDHYDTSEVLKPIVTTYNDTTSDEVQDTLRRLLNGELDELGSIPRSAVQIVATLNRRDLRLLLKLREVLWSERSNPLVPFASSSTYLTISEPNTFEFPGVLDSVQVRRLSELRLLEIAPLAYQRSNPSGVFWVSYFYGDKIVYIVSADGRPVPIGHLRLTSDAKALLNLYAAEPIELYQPHFDAVCETWRNAGLEVSVCSEGDVSGMPSAVRDSFRDIQVTGHVYIGEEANKYWREVQEAASNTDSNWS